MGIEGERIPAGRAPRSKRGRRLQGSETATVAVHRYGQRAASRCCLSAPRLKTLSSASLSLWSLSAVRLSCTAALAPLHPANQMAAKVFPLPLFTVTTSKNRNDILSQQMRLHHLQAPDRENSRGANAAAPRSPRSQPRHNFAEPASANHAPAPRPTLSAARAD
ncbi:hypothetical protein IQ07DRAFT_212462 [Pyrenochaeta sp. DS3sAY3a]|nr:hypothetical protein IQ07DRAFT_212462 [Pyrenochaeta sp. DS3sAY3a]